ncbi:MAG: hypothetical protein K2Y22_13895 [Candidatus Obscuribacterales bacterium]|nr:hypothetical protein [Candidatus Obscuribacterales bacterium]
MKTKIVAMACLLTACLTSQVRPTAIVLANPTAVKIDRAAPVKEIKTIDDLSRWMNYYYLHPQPELMITAVDYIQKNKLARPDARNSLIAFFSQLIAQNPQRLAAWTEHFKSMDDNMKGVLWTAMWQADTPESKKQLAVLTKSLNPEMQKATSKLPAAIAIEKMPIDGPAVLDRLWSCFCATGDDRYVKRIIEVLPPPNTNGSAKVTGSVASDMMRAGAAKWSLTSNAHKHKKVMVICMQARQQTSNPILKKELSAVIEKAQK